MMERCNLKPLVCWSWSSPRRTFPPMRGWISTSLVEIIFPHLSHQRASTASGIISLSRRSSHTRQAYMSEGAKPGDRLDRRRWRRRSPHSGLAVVTRYIQWSLSTHRHRIYRARLRTPRMGASAVRVSIGKARLRVRLICTASM